MRYYSILKNDVMVVYLLACKYIQNKRLNNLMYSKIPFSQVNNKMI